MGPLRRARSQDTTASFPHALCTKHQRGSCLQGPLLSTLSTKPTGRAEASPQHHPTLPSEDQPSGELPSALFNWSPPRPQPCLGAFKEKELPALWFGFQSRTFPFKPRARRKLNTCLFLCLASQRPQIAIYPATGGAPPALEGSLSSILLAADFITHCPLLLAQAN